MNLSAHLANLSGANTVNGNISLTAGGYDYVIQSNADSLTINGNITNNSGDSRGKILYLQGDGNGQVSGIIGNGTGTGPLDL